MQRIDRAGYVQPLALLAIVVKKRQGIKVRGYRGPWPPLQTPEVSCSVFVQEVPTCSSPLTFCSTCSPSLKPDCRQSVYAFTSLCSFKCRVCLLQSNAASHHKSVCEVSLAGCKPGLRTISGALASICIPKTHDALLVHHRVDCVEFKMMLPIVDQMAAPEKIVKQHMPSSWGTQHTIILVCQKSICWQLLFPYHIEAVELISPAMNTKICPCTPSPSESSTMVPAKLVSKHYRI